MYGGKKLRQKRREARIYFNAQPVVCAEYFDIKKIAEIKKYFLSSMRLRGSCRARNKFSQTLLTESAKRKILARQIFYAADFKPRPKIKIKPTRKHRIEAIKILPSNHYPNTSVIKSARRP